MRSKLWLTEGARLEALCREPAELINALCMAQIEATDFRNTGDGRFIFLVPAEKAGAAMKLGDRCGAEIRILRRRGFLHFLRRFRRRKYLLLIPLPFIILFMLLSTFLWQIDVSGNETVSRAEILAVLESMGVYPGVNGLRLDNPQIRSRMQEKLSELSWCTVQVHGSRAIVVVRERRKPPKIVDESAAVEVYAGRTGTVDELNILEGKPLVHRGDTVMEIPLNTQEKTYTAEKKTQYSLKIGDLRLNFYNDSSISQGCYDKITKETRAELFGLALPVSLVMTDYRAYRLSSLEIPKEEASALLESRLLLWLRQAAPEAEVVQTWFSGETTGGILRVHMLAQCREDIAEEREISIPRP